MVVVAVFSLAYPLIVFFGIQRLSPAFFAAILVCLAVLKFCATKNKKDWSQIALLSGTVVFSLVLAVTNNETLLRLYPAVLSLCVAFIFAASLREDENILERMARLAGEEITAQARFYTRRLTFIWVLLLSANAAIALYLALFGTLLQWTFYCGLLSYIILGGFFAMELVYRRFYIARHKSRTGIAVESGDKS